MRPNENFINMLRIGNTYQYLNDTTEVTYFHDSPSLGLVSSGFTSSDRSQTLITSPGYYIHSPSIDINSGDIRAASQWGMIAGDSVFSAICGGLIGASLPTTDSSNYLEDRLSFNNNYSFGSSGTLS